MVMAMVKRTVTAAMMVTALVLSSNLLAQGAASSGNDAHKATLVANLVEYGTGQQDVFALLSAANILSQMDGGVAMRDKHDDGSDHDANVFYRLSVILEDAKKLAESMAPDEKQAINLIIDDLRFGDGSKSFEGWLHTHYVCVSIDFFGNCVYVWTSHY